MAEQDINTFYVFNISLLCSGMNRNQHLYCSNELLSYPHFDVGARTRAKTSLREKFVYSFSFGWQRAKNVLRLEMFVRSRTRISSFPFDFCMHTQFSQQIYRQRGEGKIFNLIANRDATTQLFLPPHKKISSATHKDRKNFSQRVFAEKNSFFRLLLLPKCKSRSHRNLFHFLRGFSRDVRSLRKIRVLFSRRVRNTCEGFFNYFPPLRGFD